VEIVSDYCVVTVDSSRARFFILAPASQPEVESGPALVEQGEDLINAETQLPGRELWSDTAAGGENHTFDDHRDKHADEFKRRFAKLVAGQAVKLAGRTKAKTLVVVAEKQMLGFLRNEMHLSPKAEFTVREFAKDLSRLSPQDLQSHLAAEGLVPSRQRRS
jgi:protein required for attachment to host cells